MIVLGTLIEALATILHMLISIYIWVIIIAALVSWVQPDPYNPIVQILRRLTEPVYSLVRRYIPTVVGAIDLTPIIILLLLQFIDLFFIKLLFHAARSM